MKPRYYSHYFLLIALVFGSCDTKLDDHPVFSFYPSHEVFSEGYANKYYNHYYPTNTDVSSRTTISYTTYVKTGDASYKTELYNAAFELTGSKYYSVIGNQIRCDSAKMFQGTEVTDAIILSSTMSDWRSSRNVSYREQFQNKNGTFLYTELQKNVEDTVIMEKPAKVFLYETIYVQEDNGDTLNLASSKNYYVHGLGFFGGRSKSSSYSNHVELMEQMPLQEFRNRAAHDDRRVAYIDPEQTLDTEIDFLLCGEEVQIADYYNATPDGRYIQGKRAMLDTIYSNLDPSQIGEESGMLTFRFVVNCQGQAGRFVVEGYDMAYQRQEFDQRTVLHLYSILLRLKKWQPVKLDSGLSDAYFYITFKIENGEITEILP